MPEGILPFGKKINITKNLKLHLIGLHLIKLHLIGLHLIGFNSDYI